MSTAIDKISHKFRSLDDWHQVNKFSLILIIAIFGAIPLTVFGAIALRQVDPQASIWCGSWSSDINKDGKVNIADVNLITDKFGTTDNRYDLNLDGRIDLTDQQIIPNNFGKVCS